MASTSFHFVLLLLAVGVPKPDESVTTQNRLTLRHPAVSGA